MMKSVIEALAALLIALVTMDSPLRTQQIVLQVSDIKSIRQCVCGRSFEADNRQTVAMEFLIKMKNVTEDSGA